MGSVAEQLIANRSRKNDEDYYGVDETGLPVPNPVNDAYIVARVLSRPSFYQYAGEFYEQRHRYLKNKQSLIALCGHPKLPANTKDTNDMMWRQVKRVINEEYGLIWERLRQMTPTFSKRYIRVTKELVWDRETSSIKFYPEDLL